MDFIFSCGCITKMLKDHHRHCLAKTSTAFLNTSQNDVGQMMIWSIDFKVVSHLSHKLLRDWEKVTTEDLALALGLCSWPCGL